ncbi:peptidylprolyl isomerase [Ramlibacter sp. H39-3-26]|uniref:FKBP-type peptidyl-prolyl cis-trans isomerase n=1 Tax=Curvibacter soli TaxID=3031331 RepID=UPI0023DB1C44|nr:peptidylprolyl isomerase [Ramlibacter sp. H39-3-26]MDF1485627.1 peptidylprolyl isomerase [Ramlibacter sp. H39-3-26]
MKIQHNTVVTLRYKVTDSAGRLVEEAREPMSYLHGGYGGALPKIEAALEGQEPGYQAALTLVPTDGFGERDASLLRTIARRDFPPGVKVGGQLQGRLDDGREQLFHVVKIKGEQVLLDGNHPWAGKTLRFALRVLDVRAATEEEIVHGHAHGAHGHHHH